MTLTVLQYLRMARNQTIPPLVLELILRSGRSFYIKNIFPSMRLRGWYQFACGT
jgi:hypothetical protein